MSLLMDALKKAELAKRKTQSDSASIAAASATAPAVVEQISEANPVSTSALDFDVGPARLPPLSDHLELIDHEFDTSASAPPAVPKREKATPDKAVENPAFSLQDLEAAVKAPVSPAKATDAEAQTERETVQNLFETKQAAPSRKVFAISIGVATLCAIAAIGLYFWIELQPKSSLGPGAASRLTPPPATPTVAAPPILPIAPPTIAGLPAPQEPTQENEVEPAAPRQAKEPRSGSEIAFTPASKLFRVGSSAPQVNSSVARGYDALNRGDDSAAKAAYEQALNADPKNLDTLSGLAAVYQRQGKPELAAEYYLQILEADPKNASAQAGLIDLQSKMSPAESESRLRQALSSQPDSPALNFSLGNAYARGKRWNEAQQAYFKAMAGDPGNPDYLFNLAVSLDQLRQNKLAADFYAQAIAAAEARPAGFNKTQVNERLQKLQQQP